MIGERPLIDEEMALDTALKNVRRQNYFIMLEIEKNNLFPRNFIGKKTQNISMEITKDIIELGLYSAKTLISSAIFPP